MVCFDENGILIPSTATSAIYSKNDEQCLVDFYTQFNLCSLTVNIIIRYIDIYCIFYIFFFECTDVQWTIQEENIVSIFEIYKWYPSMIWIVWTLFWFTIFWDKWIINSYGIHDILHWLKWLDFMATHLKSMLIYKFYSCHLSPLKQF